MLERGAPVWSSVYGPSSSLQHAAQLQLLSQHQMLRQQELFMIQQHTAQVLELQRNAQIVVSAACVRLQDACAFAHQSNTHTHTRQKYLCSVPGAPEGQ